MSLVLAFLLFPGYQLLDIFGPLDIFNSLPSIKTITIGPIDKIKPTNGSLDNVTTPIVQVDLRFNTAKDVLDVLEGIKKDNNLDKIGILIPGGYGTRSYVNDETFLDVIKEICNNVDYVFSVCTGSALLAKAGILNDVKATSNKISMKSGWIQKQGPLVNWIEKARFVIDIGKQVEYWTSSGITAGMDMSLAWIAKNVDMEKAKEIANKLEYRWDEDLTGEKDDFYKE